MNGQKVFEQIREARWEQLKNPFDNSGNKITMTRNVYEELERVCFSHILVHAPQADEEPKCTIFGMEIEVIDEAEGFFSIGGLMKGINS